MFSGTTRRLVLRGPVSLKPARTPRKNSISPRAGEEQGRGLPPPAAAELAGLELATRVHQINVLVGKLLFSPKFGENYRSVAYPEFLQNFEKSGKIPAEIAQSVFEHLREAHSPATSIWERVVGLEHECARLEDAHGDRVTGLLAEHRTCLRVPLGPEID